MIPISVVIIIFGVGGFVIFMAGIANGSGQGSLYWHCSNGSRSFGAVCIETENRRIDQQRVIENGGSV
jgi:hypothetical protein